MITIQDRWMEKETGEEEDDNANKSVSYNPCTLFLSFEGEEDFLRQTLKWTANILQPKTHSGQYLG